MNEEQAKKTIRKAKRKSILIWYKFLKSEMNTVFCIKNGFTLGCSYSSMPNYGYNEAARLLCFKNKNYTIKKGKFFNVLYWKFNCNNK
jgi:hypothetical protein